MSKRNLRVMSVSSLLGLTLLLPQLATAGDLGVGLRVVPNTASNSEISGNTKLWFVVKQDDETSRELVLSGSSSMDQLVRLSLVKLQRIDGEPAISNEASDLAPWVVFSENNFVLRKNQTKSVTMKIAPPTDAKSGSYEAYLIASASDARVYKSSGKVTEAVIKNSARVAQPVFVGVGNYEDFVVDFEIADVDGVKTLQDKFIRVFLDNKGKTPISPSGQIQLKNMDFEQGTLGPFPFYSATISPDSKAFIDVQMPNTLNPGKWKIFVSASQGNVTETREFVKNLTFTNRFDFLGGAIRAAVALLGILLAFWAYRTLSPRNNSDSRLRLKTKRSIRRRGRVSKETQALINELQARVEASERKAAELKKTRRKQAPVKKPTKKVATKKVATKKVASPLKSPKKKTTKKVATKRK